ncbi:MAG TPA: MBL fold metallo-hydrolase [Methanoregulaceae archaeon]|nr:MBL fold metallo-hydrolase [Methanoregulaceae archaeon]
MPVRWIPGGGYLGNSYLVGNVLVDAAVLPGAIAPYKEEIESIVLTHCHYDHIAHAKEIAHMCGASLCIHRLDSPGLNDDVRNLSFNFGARTPGIIGERLLDEGDMIGDLRILHTPGHTPGSVCLYYEEDLALFSGDTVFTDGGFGRFDFPGGSRDDLAQSLERLSALAVEKLYPGHGSPVERGGGRHIAAALQLIKISYE